VNPELLDPALEEATRLDPAVNFVFRVTREDIQVGETKFKAGDVVFVSNHAINRDPVMFAEPDRLRAPRLGLRHHGLVPRARPSRYIDSGAEIPSSPSAEASVTWAARANASRRAERAGSVGSTTRASR